MKDYITPKQRLKSPRVTDAGLFWAIYLLLAIGAILAWLK